VRVPALPASTPRVGWSCLLLISYPLRYTRSCGPEHLFPSRLFATAIVENKRCRLHCPISSIILRCISSMRRGRPHLSFHPPASMLKLAPYAWIDHAGLTFIIPSGLFHERRCPPPPWTPPPHEPPAARIGKKRYGALPMRRVLH
jgi:hypothetical protein